MFALNPFVERRRHDPFFSVFDGAFENAFFRDDPFDAALSRHLAQPAPPLPQAIIPVNLSETDDHVLVEADLPGARKEDVKLALDGRVLTITASAVASGGTPSGEEEEEEAAAAAAPEEDSAEDAAEDTTVKHHVRERAVQHCWSMRQSVSRRLRLPHAVDADAADASLEDGVLRLKLPKVETHRAIGIE
uniref:SHSP domain-containing protein n=2 Tax=Phaeomonas parva TaxID=124430 RepID=A0A7S1XV06_9STRA|mmetsp:Transcript_41748/g.130752  ORF Transcript_41748/g.130752 Transcript_41748/m.130752 type:complete len:190 (+) Transcript_41748:250-819(+)